MTGRPRNLNGLTNTCPTRRSSDLKRGAGTAGEGEGEGEGETVTLPRRDYEALVEAAEERQALRAYAATRDEEAFPAEVVNAIIDGANPVRTWRKYRGLKQADLAERSEEHTSEIQSLMRNSDAVFCLKKQNI